MIARALLVIGLLAVAAPDAHAYRLMKIRPQPELLYYVGLKDWKKPMARAVKALNRARVGVRLVKAQIPEQASIQVGRLEKRCGIPGQTATTLNIEGGYAAIYLPFGCRGTAATIIAAHELGHALGLKHENRRCALMNSSGTGPKSIPTNCLGRRHPWNRKPFRADDLAGLRKLFHNTRPRVTLDLRGPTTVPAGTTVRFRIKIADRERNVSQHTTDYGDGSREEHDASEAPPTFHTYTTPGTYRLRVSAVDFYGRRDTESVTITVT